MLERQAQREQIARVAGAGTEPVDRPLHVAHLDQALAKTFERGRVVQPRSHGCLPALNRIDRRERLRKPVAQASRAHGRHGAIDRGVKRAGLGRVALKWFEDFQVAQRGGIQRQEIGALIKRKPRQVRYIALQMLREIVQHGARRANGRGSIP